MCINMNATVNLFAVIDINLFLEYTQSAPC